jgi:hypothetical protein
VSKVSAGRENSRHRENEFPSRLGDHAGEGSGASGEPCLRDDLSGRVVRRDRSLVRASGKSLTKIDDLHENRKRVKRKCARCETVFHEKDRKFRQIFTVLLFNKIPERFAFKIYELNGEN